MALHTMDLIPRIYSLLESNHNKFTTLLDQISFIIKQHNCPYKSVNILFSKKKKKNR